MYATPSSRCFHRLDCCDNIVTFPRNTKPARTRCNNNYVFRLFPRSRSTNFILKHHASQSFTISSLISYIYTPPSTSITSSPFLFGQSLSLLTSTLKTTNHLLYSHNILDLIVIYPSLSTVFPNLFTTIDHFDNIV